MIIRDLNDARRGERRVNAPGWESVRLLLAGDGMGFSFHITTIEPGARLGFHYKHHLESVYCIAGEGSIEDCASGEVHVIRPGVMYALDQHDEHVLSAGECELVLACCFNPPVTGVEVHRADGSYAPTAEAA